VSRGQPVRTLFFGSGAFAVPILEALHQGKQTRVVGVVTAPDRPSGRRAELAPTPVALCARALGLPLVQPERVRAASAIDEIAALEPELGVLADYGQIIPKEALELPRHGILNVHPSLLPRHRGATPIQATIAAGDSQAGVTIMLMDEGLDTGPIVSQETWMLEGNEIAPELEAEAARRGAELLSRSLEGWLDGTIRPVDQAPLLATLTRPLRRDDARLDWSKAAYVLERLVRANEPWPGSFIETSQGRLGIITASVAASAPGDIPGQIVRLGDRPALATADGRLVLEAVQLAGRRAMRGDDFLRGKPGIIGSSVAPGP